MEPVAGKAGAGAKGGLHGLGIAAVVEAVDPRQGEGRAVAAPAILHRADQGAVPLDVLHQFNNTIEPAETPDASTTPETPGDAG